MDMESWDPPFKLKKEKHKIIVPVVAIYGAEDIITNIVYCKIVLNSIKILFIKKHLKQQLWVLFERFQNLLTTEIIVYFFIT